MASSVDSKRAEGLEQRAKVAEEARQIDQLRDGSSQAKTRANRTAAREQTGQAERAAEGRTRSDQAQAQPRARQTGPASDRAQPRAQQADPAKAAKLGELLGGRQTTPRTTTPPQAQATQRPVTPQADRLPDAAARVDRHAAVQRPAIPHAPRGAQEARRADPRPRDERPLPTLVAAQRTATERKPGILATLAKALNRVFGRTQTSNAHQARRAALTHTAAQAQRQSPSAPKGKGPTSLAKGSTTTKGEQAGEKVKVFSVAENADPQAEQKHAETRQLARVAIGNPDQFDAVAHEKNRTDPPEKKEVFVGRGGKTPRGSDQRRVAALAGKNPYA